MRYLAKGILRLILLAALAPAGQAAGGDAASEQRAKSQYIAAVEKTAAQGNVKAQVTLALLHLQGDVEKPDYALAASHCRKGVEAGIAAARMCLGTLYFYGKGVPEDFDQAMLMFRRLEEQGEYASLVGDIAYGRPQDQQSVRVRAYIEALRRKAELGDVESQATLGFVFMGCDTTLRLDACDLSEGAGANARRGEGWLRRAAESGHAGAQYILGRYLLYLRPMLLGVPDDEVEAAKWLEMAASKGNPAAQYLLAVVYSGNALPRKARPGDRRVRPDVAKVISLATRAAVTQVNAQTLLGRTYLQNQEIRDYDKALSWLQKAAPRDVQAMTMLGTMHEKGLGVPQSFPQAIEWYRKAGDLDFAPAIYALARLYETGQGVPQDQALAISYYERISNSSAVTELPVHAKLAAMYENGGGVAKQPAKALHHYQLAAASGDIPSLKKMIEVYRRGLLDAKADQKKAAEWTQRLKDAMAEK